MCFIPWLILFDISFMPFDVFFFEKWWWLKNLNLIIFITAVLIKRLKCCKVLFILLLGQIWISICKSKDTPSVKTTTSCQKCNMTTLIKQYIFHEQKSSKLCDQFKIKIYKKYIYIFNSPYLTKFQKMFSCLKKQKYIFAISKVHGGFF